MRATSVTPEQALRNYISAAGEVGKGLDLVGKEIEQLRKQI